MNIEEQVKGLQDRIDKLEAGKTTEPEKTTSEVSKQKRAQVTAAVKKFAASQNYNSKK
jgi:hypothetical protein